MGSGYICKCDKCGYKFQAHLGIGMGFPFVYQETIEKMKSGGLGEKARAFFEAHPEGVVNCEYVVAMCRKCKILFRVRDLTMYVPRTEAVKEKYPNGVDYIFGRNRDRFYEPHTLFAHVCPECSGAVEIVPNSEAKIENEGLKCPKCDGTMRPSGDMVCWD